MSFEPKFADLVEVFQHSVTKYADRPLFGVKERGEWKWMTYAEFGRQVDRFRAGLSELGVVKGDRVAIICDNRPEWAIAAYASYGLGAAFVPMYEDQLDDEWKYIVSDSGAKIVVVANDRIRDRMRAFLGELPDVSHLVVIDTNGRGAKDEEPSFADVITLGSSDAVAPVALESSDPAGFIYTSGTTDHPKGVILSHGNFASNVSAVHDVFPISSDDRSLSFLPWAHSFGQTVELHALLSMGAAMGIAESVDKILADLREIQPTLLISVPHIFNRMYDTMHRRVAAQGGLQEKLFHAALENADVLKEAAIKKRPNGWAELKHGVFDRVVFGRVRERFGGKLRYAFSGGAALSREVAEFIDKLGITVYEGYGLTETSPIATVNFPGARKIGSVGKPIPGVKIVIDTSVTEDRTAGEVQIFGHNVMQGYHGLASANEEVFVEHPEYGRGIRSGDMGKLDGEGFLHITGRIHEQYKLQNGKYVVPTPLEDRLKLSPFITNVMLYGLNHPHNVAVIVPDFDVLGPWCAANGVPGGPSDMALSAKVRGVFEREIDKQSGDFKQYEKVRDFVLVTEDFTTDNGMLTPTLKVKRRNVLERYQAQIDALYDDAP